MAEHRSILEELNSLHAYREKNYLIETRALHVIESAVNLLSEIEKNYDSKVAKDLQNRLLNSIRGKDASKFTRGIKKHIKESKNESIRIIRS